MEEMKQPEELEALQKEELEALQSSGKKLTIAGFVLSVVGTVFALFGATVFTALLSLPCAIIGLVLSVIGGKKLKQANVSRGLATAGLVLGIIATSISGIAFLTCRLCGLCYLNAGLSVLSLL